MIGRMKVLLLCVWLSFAASVASASLPTGLPPGDWRQIQDNIFRIYHEPADEANAREALELLQKSIPTITHDLKLQPPDSIRIFIAPNKARFRYLTRGLPDWTGGVAYPAHELIVVQSPKLYPNRGQFNVTLVHEMIHVLTDHRGPSHLPKWLGEGLAMYLSGETMYKRRTPLARAVVLGKTHTLEDIESMLRFGPEDARVAYLQSIHFVDFLVENFGWDVLAEMIEGYRTGRDQDEIFLGATGRDMFDVEAAWHRNLKSSYKWWMIVEWFDLDMFIWTSAALFVVIIGGVTIYRRKKYLSEEEPFDPDYPELMYWEAEPPAEEDEPMPWEEEDEY